MAEELGTAWHRYIKLAIYVVGVSGGVRIWELEKYITPRSKDVEIPVLRAPWRCGADGPHRPRNPSDA